MAGDPYELTGKVSVVTGGGSGIGAACALALAAVGSHVAVLDKSGATARATADAILASGGKAVFIECDVSDKSAVGEAAGEVEARFGRCNVLVNNAGIIRAGSLATLSLDDWNLLLSINLTGYFLCAQAFGAQMRGAGRGGSIVNMASVASNHATPVAGAYSVAKAGVQMLSRQLAIEWGGDGIRSNCVNPGLILTPLSQSMYDRPGIREQREAMVPAGRIGTPEDVAEIVLFLASERSAYINGEEITVDGGMVRNLMSLIPRAGYEQQKGETDG